MNFTKHSELRGKHAFLSPSSYAWLRYDENKLIERYATVRAAEQGTELHDFAEHAIKLKLKLKGRDYFAQYVNDCIGFKMTPEVQLYYSDYCFGTSDAISFTKNTLRIFDLKTGVSKASMDQLIVYAALFCLEYHVIPAEIDIELRIYQSVFENGYDDYFPSADVITEAMDIIKAHSYTLSNL